MVSFTGYFFKLISAFLSSFSFCLEDLFSAAPSLCADFYSRSDISKLLSSEEESAGILLWRFSRVCFYIIIFNYILFKDFSVRHL